MPAPTPVQPPKPIIIKRSLSSYSVPDPSTSSLSSSPTSSETTTCNIHGSTYEVRTMRSTCSLPTRPPSPLPNIKFAPLPTIEPRKRKSNVQLGVAARSRMIQQRRNARVRNPPTWTDMNEEAVDDEPVPMDQDPFEVFGKYVFGKGRHLWKRVSQKGTAPTPVVVGKVVQDPDSADPERTPLATLQQPSVPHLRQGSDNGSCRSDSADHSSEGGVWEDEIGEELRLQLLKLATPATAGDAAEKKSKG